MAQRALSNPKIKPIWDSVVTEILDPKQDKVTGVRVQNLKTKKQTVVDCAGVFVAIGHIPNTQFFKGDIDMDEDGYIVPKRGMETSVPGVFVAVECSNQLYRQAVRVGGIGCGTAIY